MAETYRPYQSIGEMLRQPQFPEGVGLKESQRTMLVLSQALDRMANFELQKDQQRAKVEGAEFGVENAPTLADIKTANESNKDAFEAFDENTIFGSAAKNAALSVAENEVLIDATQSMTNLVLAATANNTNPIELLDQLNSTIIGYVDALRPSAPALAEKMNARLKLNAIGEFETYTKAHLSGGVDTVNNTNIIGYRNRLNKTRNSLTAILSGKETFNLETLKSERNGLLAALETLGLKTGPQTTAIKEIDSEMKSWFIDQFTTEFFGELDGIDDVKQKYLMVEKIRKGTFKTDDPELNKLISVLEEYNNLPEDQRSGLAIPTYEELSQAALSDVDELLRIENSIDQKFEFDAGNRANEIEIELKDIMLSTEPLTSSQILNTRKLIKELKELGRDQEATTLEENILDILDFPGHPPRSNGEDFNELSEMERTHSLTYSAILSRKAKLSREDFDAFNTAIEAQLDQSMEAARQKIITKIQFDPANIRAENALPNNQKIALRQYREVLEILRDERVAALKSGEDFDPIARVKVLIEEKITENKNEALAKELDKAVGFVKQDISRFTKHHLSNDIDWTDTITADNKEEMVRNMIAVWNSLKGAKKIDDIPPAFRTQQIISWMNDQSRLSFAERIEKKIAILRKGLND
jgi:hypothetical protein